jgi:hypothetical protein
VAQIARRRPTLAIALGLGLATLGPGAGIALAAATPSNDSYGTAEDTDLVVGAPGVLANDGAPADGMILCVGAVDTTGLTGALDWHGDGSFTYSPAANFHGDGSGNTFTYTVYEVAAEAPCTGAAGSTATAEIAVTAVNDAPTAKADSFTGLKDLTLNIAAPGVLANDGDIDGDLITAVNVSAPTHGVVVLGADGSFSYTPATGYVGPDAFSYRATDGTSNSPIRVVSITVKAVPTPTPSPTPGPTPTPPPSPTPEPTATPEAAPSDTPEPSATAEALPTFAVTTAAPSATPSASFAAEPAARSGGLSLPVLLVLVLFAVLVIIGAAFAIPRWINQQRGIEDPGDRP